MTNTYLFAHDYDIIKNCAVGYCLNEKNALVHGDYAYVPNFRGAGGLYSTTYDLYLFARAVASGALINKDTMQLMCTPYHPKQNYGYGCSIEDIQGRKCMLHNGVSSGGFRSNLSIFIDDEVYIVILGNVLSSWVYDAQQALAAIMFGEPYEFPVCKPVPLDEALCRDYPGSYMHPAYPEGYKVEMRENKFYVPRNREITPVGPDQFCHLGMKNILYTFARSHMPHN